MPTPIGRLTVPSSGTVLPFIQKFEAWRETWHRQVLADRQLGHRDKSVAGFLLWYLNRQDRACFPSYATIATGVGITRRDAMRCISRLMARGHLLRRPRERKTNYYSPRVVAPCHQGDGTLPPDGGGKTTTLTSDSRTSDLTLEKSLKTIQESGCPREEGTRVLPSHDPFISPSPSNGGSRANGGPPGKYAGYTSPLMVRLEAYERRTGKTLPRDKRGGWWLTPDQLAAVEGDS